METAISQILQLASELAQRLNVAEGTEESINIDSRNLHYERCTAPNERSQFICLGTLDRELDVLARVQGRIDAVDDLAARFSEIKSRRNQLTLAYCLPDEIYSYIFELIHSAGRDTQVCWSVSQVSRVWRQIALNTPRIWSTIDKIHREFVETCITRSGDVSLDISLRMHPNIGRFADEKGAAQERKVAGSLALLLAHAHRWRSLSLFNIPLNPLSPAFRTPAPRLQSLELDYLGIDTEELMGLSDNPFAGSSPLRSLRLAGVRVPLTASVYVGLTSLQLENISAHVHSPIHPRQFLDVLKASPLLQLLSVDNVYVLGRSVAAESPPIQMLHLQRIHIDETEAHILRLILSSIRGSSSLAITGSQILREGEGSVFPTQGLQATLPSLWNITSLHFAALVDTDDDDDYDDASVHIDGRTNRDTVLDITFIPEFHTGAIARLLFLSLTHELFLPHLEKLVLSDIDDLGVRAADFVNVLATMQRLSYLELTGCHKSFVRALVITPTRRPCPRVDTLVLTDSTVDGPTLIDVALSRPGTMKAEAEDTWSSIDRLVLSCCELVGEAAVVALRHMVNTVDSVTYDKDSGYLRLHTPGVSDRSSRNATSSE
ncbi:hypothetical protein BOTBODRAFT_67705 [Botryobasidium botryosum FD-172 SS1]|uniref:Uncharacterized protein n=1 Tax=Botryobasidium botryosum (strain FD-172 SS1) TaxID=930990 RepID=A0A067MBG2_BOTB1|nr:hypothetical protein BOTBODRAFT_67705 [Botryobasidium botryosum FD-172 SS1]